MEKKALEDKVAKFKVEKTAADKLHHAELRLLTQVCIYVHICVYIRIYEYIGGGC